MLMNLRPRGVIPLPGNTYLICVQSISTPTDPKFGNSLNDALERSACKSPEFAPLPVTAADPFCGFVRPFPHRARSGDRVGRTPHLVDVAQPFLEKRPKELGPTRTSNPKPKEATCDSTSRPKLLMEQLGEKKNKRRGRPHCDWLRSHRHRAGSSPPPHHSVSPHRDPLGTGVQIVAARRYRWSERCLQHRLLLVSPVVTR